MKDVVLLLPALVFLVKHKDMHRLFSKTTRNIIIGVSTIGLIWYCLSNFMWDLPHEDFRPFREGVNIRDQRQAEMDANLNVQITHWKLKNNSTGKIVELSSQVYYKEMATNYKKGDWTVIERIKTEPTIAATKLSEFMVNDQDGFDISEDLLNDPEYRFWIISYSVPYDVTYETVTDLDTLFVIDSIRYSGSDQEIVVKRIDKIEEKEVKNPVYAFDPNYVRDYQKEMLGLIASTNIPTVALLGGVDQVAIEAFKKKIGAEMNVYEADDILLKTIIRSNPGLMLMKDGVVIKKWHKENLPSQSKLKEFLGR